MAETITFKVNGETKTVSLEGHEKLLEILRDKLSLTGTKCGCDDASCGACTVVVNGEAKKSCVFPQAKLAGAEVTTIEGLAGKAGELHPIQQAMIDGGAVQCGYCIPGIVMELHGLFSKNPDAGHDEITEALSRHFCRCTGYEAIMASALLAQKYLKEGKGGKKS
ncbi:MAG: (2Fe-2S)-binding protein [Candidatus Riflebacteria bacterium]|nr:(2Fe-2S)-binding protein [Candidatus Riflebacteria bacterium]